MKGRHVHVAVGVARIADSPTRRGTGIASEERVTENAAKLDFDLVNEVKKCQSGSHSAFSEVKTPQNRGSDPRSTASELPSSSHALFSVDCNFPASLALSPNVIALGRQQNYCLLRKFYEMAAYSGGDDDDLLKEHDDEEVITGGQLLTMLEEVRFSKKSS